MNLTRAATQLENSSVESKFLINQILEPLYSRVDGAIHRQEQKQNYSQIYNKMLPNIIALNSKGH